MRKFAILIHILGMLCLLAGAAYSQASLVKDILPQSESSYPSWFATVNNTLFFTAYNSPAYDGTTYAYQKLWKSDGTAEGTVMISDNAIGNHQFLINFNNTLFFVVADGMHGQELWKSDGTPEGTILFKDLVPGMHGSNPAYLTDVNGTLFFSAIDNTNDRELWKSDGTPEGTVLVKNIRRSGSSTPIHLTNVNGTLFFTAYNWDKGSELWKSDGTENGTVLVKDIFPGRDNSHPVYITDVNGTLLFRANDGIHGYELWKSDGTREGTVLVKDIFPGSTSSGLTRFVAFNNTLYFTANSEYGYKVWKSDGTPEGTVLADEINSKVSASSIGYLYVVENILYFSAHSSGHGAELWRTDGTAAGTYLAAEMNPGAASSDPTSFGSIGHTLFFRANDGVHGHELWKFEPAGTKPVPGFTANNACLGEEISFTDISSGVATNAGYLWDFGDGTTSTTKGDVNHTYAAAGDYQVTLTITQGAFSASEHYTVTVHALPEVSLSPFAAVNETEAAFALSGGVPAGGTYSGSGISHGMFDPSTVGPGEHEITYTYTDPATSCTESATQLITVEALGQNDAVVSFTLVNADTDTDIMELTDGMQLSLHALPHARLSIRASTEPATVGSVQLMLQGPLDVTRKENTAPYTLFGDESENYEGEYLGAGSYTITATPYSKANLKGEKGMSLSLDFEIAEETLDCAGFTASLTNVQDVSTCGFNDGSAMVDVSGHGGEVTYAWSHGATTVTASGLSAGDYTVTVTDAQGCSTTLSVTIGNPALPDVTLAPFSSVKEGYPAFDLSGGVPAGGTYSGTGVSNGMFDPSAVEAGEYEIIYTYTDPNTNCANSVSQWITVEPLILGIPVHVVSLTLVNADTDRDIVELTDGMELNIHNLPDAPLTIRAETYPSTVSSVILSLSGPLQSIRKEGVAPYALFGDEDGNYKGENFAVGSYTISATPYLLNEVEEEVKWDSLGINFTIVEDLQASNLRTLNADANALVNDVEEKMTQQHPDGFAVYPNPFTNVIKVAISDFAGESVEIHLIDLYGKTLMMKNIETTSGSLAIDVENANIPVGTYVLKVIWDAHVEMMKVIKQN